LKRKGNLFERIVDFSNLLHAYKKAVRGKRYWDSTLDFTFNFEKELMILKNELIHKTYIPGEFRTFTIKEPKVRMISVAPFRDRVVHHALCNVIEPIFEKIFIFDSYACRTEKGTHSALMRFKFFTQKNRFVLRGDIRKFFPSIDHEMLLSIIEKKIKDIDCLWLIQTIINHSNPQETVMDYFPGDDLFTPIMRRKGLPIGNQTSQFFANVYLNPLDHFVKETLKCRNYVRYCDDFALWSDDKDVLNELKKRIKIFLEKLRLKLNDKKTRIFRTSDGVRFVGFIVYPHKTRICGENVRRFRKRLGRIKERYAVGEITEKAVKQSVCGWIGHAIHADSYRLRTLIFDDFSL
jgi:retron-type reverse transcriptase